MAVDTPRLMSAFLVSKKPLGGKRLHGAARARAAQLRPHTSHTSKKNPFHCQCVSASLLPCKVARIDVFPAMGSAVTYVATHCMRPAPITDGGRVIRKKSVIEEAGSLLEASKHRFFKHRRTWRVPMSSSPGGERTDRRSEHYAPRRKQNVSILIASLFPALVSTIPCFTLRALCVTAIPFQYVPTQTGCKEHEQKHASTVLWFQAWRQDLDCGAILRVLETSFIFMRTKSLRQPLVGVHWRQSILCDWALQETSPRCQISVSNCIAHFVGRRGRRVY
jgi:hypothetical protein